MFTPTFISRTLPGLALAAAFTLTACSDHIDPIAPRSEAAPTPNSFLGLPLTPPALTAEMQAALGNPEVPGGPLLSTTATASSAFTASASAASQAAQSITIGAQGITCQGNQVIVRAPIGPVTSQVPQVQLTWWYPVLFRWNGTRWAEMPIAPLERWGWAYAQLPSRSATWTFHATRQSIGSQMSRQTPGYYAVVSHLYFNALQRWASEVEVDLSTHRQWCQIR